MAIEELPDFDSISEFGKYNGDCFFSEALSQLHSIDPGAFPLDFAMLNALVQDAYGKGLAEASGAINIPHASLWLSGYAWTDSHGVKHKGVQHATYCSYGGRLAGDTAPYSPYILDDSTKTAGPTQKSLHGLMKARSGLQGISIERGQGAPLPGDEPNVVYHYIGDGGINTGPTGNGEGGFYLFSDGDNSADHRDGSPTPAIPYTWSQVAATNPVGCIVWTEPIVARVQPVWHPQSDGSAIDDKQHHVGAGLYAAIVSGKRTNVDAVIGPQEYDAAGSTWVALADGSGALWSKAVGSVFAPLAGDALMSLYNANSRLTLQLAAARGVATPAPVPSAPADPVAAQSKAVLLELRTVLNALPAA